MILAIGYNPIIEKLQDITGYIIYPRFFDDKKTLLIDRNYKRYLKELWFNKNRIEVALYPDNIDYLLPVPKDITYVVPIHTLSQLEIADKLTENNYKVITGYASDQKYRDYTIDDFIKASKYKNWYLGISTKHELKEAMLYSFDYGDITLMLLGRFQQLKDINYVRRKLKELSQLVSRHGKQLTLFDFSQSNGTSNL
ncbi:hypothetical protein [Sulfolobus monocaudavirus SMV3]|uniref:hypothetical protein n=1 Tax=Sulfolobus monocaudavirus SMV3 TaxID=1732177 RepID=UPI000705A081|nr:hypothetical protein AXI69_gp68 [Sulfolobus monocaudavirus SMV3]ALG97005.1 hypothetical protein [Sulfolobus monocaudavirus SMV3]